MKNLTIKNVGILSAAKISGIIGVVIGLVAGSIYAALFAVMGAAMMAQNEGGGASAMFVGLGSVCIMPILYGGLSFVFGALYAFIFNVSTRFTGGLEIEVDER